VLLAIIFVWTVLISRQGLLLAWTTNRTELELARWLGSHGAAVALQATLGASVSLAVAYLSYELVEKRFLRLKRLFQPGKKPALHSLAAPNFLQGRQGAELISSTGSVETRSTRGKAWLIQYVLPGHYLRLGGGPWRA